MTVLVSFRHCGGPLFGMEALLLKKKKITFSAGTRGPNSCKGYISASLERLATVYFESCWLNKHHSGGFEAVAFPGEKRRSCSLLLILWHFTFPPHSEQTQVGPGVTLGTRDRGVGDERMAVSLPLDSRKQAGLHPGVGFSLFLFLSSGWRWWWRVDGFVSVCVSRQGSSVSFSRNPRPRWPLCWIWLKFPELVCLGSDDGSL